MACLSSQRISRIRADIAKKEAQLLKLETALDDASEGIKKFRFDSAEASQQTERHNPSELLDAIDRISSQIDSLYAKLNGTGLVNMNMRRKNQHSYPGGYHY